MRQKMKAFRSLLLESLENRSLLAAVGFDDAWQFTQHDTRIELRYVQVDRAQVGAIFVNVSPTTQLQWKLRPAGRPSAFDVENTFEIEPEGEPPAFIHPPRTSEPGVVPVPPQHANPHPPEKPTDPGSASKGPDRATLAVPNLAHPTLSILQTIGSNGSRLTNQTPPREISLTGTSAGNIQPPYTPIVAPSINNSVNSQSNQAGSSSLANAVRDVFNSSQVTFDFSVSERGNDSFASVISNNATDATFRFSRSGLSQNDGNSVKSDAANRILDQALAAQVAGKASLEGLLSDLAEDHYRSRSSQAFDANQPSSQFDSRRHTDFENNSDVAELAFAGGGLIALALNRDSGPMDLAQVAEDVHRENRTWVANVGVYREFENAAIAATDFVATRFSGAISRSTRTAAFTEDTNRSQTEVGDAKVHPLLASSTAALGVMLFSLRRVRKNVRLMYTKRG